MASDLLANTPLINYFRYKQTTSISANTNPTCYVITAFADGGNGQLVLTTTGTDEVGIQESITIASTANYNGNYTVISKTSTTINVSGTFVSTETGTWELNTNGTGGVAGEPLDFGVIYFYDQDDKVTPQATYSDRAKTIVNPNPITLDAVGSYPVIYLLPEPYYIEIYDKFNNLVATLDDYLPEDQEDIEGSSNVENLFATYGFDTIIDTGDYSNNPLPLDTPQNAVSGGWYWEINTTNTSEQNTYFFTPLGDSSLVGNPKNTVTFKSTNNGSGDTVKNWVAVIGDYNAFQGQQLKFSIFIRILSGGAENLTLQIRRSRGVSTNDAPIPVGTIPISAIRTQQTATFTVPVLTDSNYSNNDTLSFLIANPINSDFEIELTGSWLQLSPDDTLDISETPVSQQGVQEWAGRGFNILKNPDFSANAGLPLAIGLSQVISLNQTGAIFIAAKSSDFNYAIPMNFEPGTLLTRNVPITFGKNPCNANRLIDYLKNYSITQSRLTITATRDNNIAELTTGIGSTQLNAASTNAAPRITVNKTTDEFAYKISARIDDRETQRVRFTFVDQFAPTQNSFEPTYTSGIVDNTSMRNAKIYLPNKNPEQSPMVCWIGTTKFATDLQSEVLSSDKKPGQCYFSNHLGLSIVNPGSNDQNAQVDIRFSDNKAVFHSENRLYFYETNRVSNNPSWSGVGGSAFLYSNRTESFGQADNNNNQEKSSGTLTTGYIAWSDSTSNVSPQPFDAPHVLRYSIGGNTGTGQPNSSVGPTAVCEIQDNATGKQIALATSQTINTRWVLDIEIVSTPNNGDYVNFSGQMQDFVLVFIESGNPDINPQPSRIPVFVEFNNSDSTNTIAQLVVDAINDDIYGVPYWPDLGLPALDSYNNASLAVDLTYFMVT